MNRILSILLCLLLYSCSISHYPDNNHKKAAYKKRQSTYDLIMRINKPLYKKCKEGDNNISQKENSEWQYRRHISGTNNLKDSYKNSGGYDD